MRTLALSDGASIGFDVVGSGTPVLVCHGGPSTTHAYLRDDLTPLTTSCELTFWDYRGSGASPAAPAESYTFERLADDAAELATSLGHELFDVLAHSLGGFVALQCAIRHPDRVRRLALIDTAPSGNVKRMAIPTLRALGPRRTSLALWRAASYLALWSWRSESDARSLARFSIMATLQEGAAQHRATVKSREVLANNDNAPHLEKQSAAFDVVDQLSGIQQQTLVIYGSQDAPFVAGAQLLLAHLPHARALRLEGCGHHPLVERHDEVLSQLADFLTPD